MKIRLGYVSNSSTSSFVIVGIVFSEDEMKNLFGISFEELDDIYKFFECLELRNGIENYSEEQYIVGYDIAKMKDDQTFLEFKESVLEELKKKGYKGDINSIKIRMDAGYC